MPHAPLASRPRRKKSGEARRGAHAGLATREAAVRVLTSVLRDKRPLDESLEQVLSQARFRQLAGADRGFVRMIVATALRRHGQIEDLLARFLARGLPPQSGALNEILLAAVAQLSFLGTPPHAAIDIAVEQTKRDRHARRYRGLVNAVLRRIAKEGAEILAGQAGEDAVRLNVPAWLWSGWVAAYGEGKARAIAHASLLEAPLDLTLRAPDEAAVWAARLGGIVLATGTIRLAHKGPIEALPGFAEGAWWVQDAAAALPARLLGEVAGKRIADLCAAPGGKTLQLAAAGAEVVSVDVSERRLLRLRENLARMGLASEIVVADATRWAPGQQFDAVLLDAPCLATGTIRRHPDILHLKSPADLDALVALQERLLENAARLVAPGGLLLYCTCSLEPAECERQIARFLAWRDDFTPLAITPQEVGGEDDWIDSKGQLRTLPCHVPRPLSGHDLPRPQLPRHVPPATGGEALAPAKEATLDTPPAPTGTGEGPTPSGLDGFFAARLKRLA